MADIRLATATDLDQVVRLLEGQFEEHAIALRGPAIARAVQRLLDDPEKGRVLVAVRDGAVVGVAALSFMWPLEHGDRGSWLEELYVEPAHRGGGIGGALLAAACDLAAGCGAVAVDLEVESGHERAARLYERAGFRPLQRARWVRRLTRG